MKIRTSLLSISLVLLFIFSGATAAKQSASTRDQIKQQIIDESIEAYPGNCPCPFNRARNGSACGKRSAWSKAGGYAPVCYKDEVTDEMIDQWREGHS